MSGTASAVKDNFGHDFIAGIILLWLFGTNASTDSSDRGLVDGTASNLGREALFSTRYHP